MADWNQLLDDPLFNAGLGLLGGAATPNPWGVAADQLNKYQALRQNRELQKMHSKLYEAQARKYEQDALEAERARADAERARQGTVDWAMKQPAHVRDAIMAGIVAPKDLSQEYSKTLYPKLENELAYTPQGREQRILRNPYEAGAVPLGGFKQDIPNAAEIAGAVAEQRALLPGKMATAAAGANRQMVNVNAYLPASEEAQRDYIKNTADTRKILQNVPDALANIAKMRALVPQSRAFMGTGGESLLAMANFLKNRAGIPIDPVGIKSASELRARTYQGVLENLKKVDAQPTERQQAALQEAVGNLGTDPDAFGDILNIQEEALRSRVSRHNVDVADAEGRGVKFPFKPQIDLGGRKVYNPDTGRLE